MMVSVIMPAYNAGRFIKRAIYSILDQSYTDLEVLICDDNSTDDTFDVVSNVSDARVTLLRNDVNVGYLKTCNDLFARCNGDFITFQDADDWSHPKRIEKQLDFLSTHRRIDCVGTGSILTDSYGVTYGTNLYPAAHTDIVAQFSELSGVPFCPASVTFRRNVLQNGINYREYFNRIGAEDCDWIMRISESHKLANLSEPLYFYRRHGESLSNNFMDVNDVSFHSTAIAYFLYTQRLSSGKDSLMRDAFDEIDAFLDGRKKRISMNPYPYYQNLLFSHYLNGSFGSVAELYFKILKQAPFCMKQYLFPLKLLKLALTKLLNEGR